MADRDDADDKVGYCKPPKHSQYPKGKSGNPGGRPKGARGIKAELEAELNEKVTVTVDGKPKRFSKRRLILKTFTTKAIKGNVAAADKLIGRIIQVFGVEEETSKDNKISDNDMLIVARLLQAITVAGEVEYSEGDRDFDPDVDERGQP